jgi:NAD(P)-dependent dehydrogenase (short-subunit alcohol dehydrogenase family)
VTAPMLGAYSASKFALEALTDALRLELYPWGIQVVSIQPGVIRTDFGTSALQRADALLPRLSDEIHDLYGETIAKERGRATQSGQGIPPEDVAKVILKAAQARHPRTRYLVGQDARLIAFLRAILPDNLMDRLTRLMR